jgi:hypothetical protein
MCNSRFTIGDRLKDHPGRERRNVTVRTLNIQIGRREIVDQDTINNFPGMAVIVSPLLQRDQLIELRRRPVSGHSPHNLQSRPVRFPIVFHHGRHGEIVMPCHRGMNHRVERLPAEYQLLIVRPCERERQRQSWRHKVNY